MPCPLCIINIPLNYYSGKDEGACIQRSVISLGETNRAVADIIIKTFGLSYNVCYVKRLSLPNQGEI